LIESFGNSTAGQFVLNQIKSIISRSHEFSPSYVV
jgi:hypothetical protein